MKVDGGFNAVWEDHLYALHMSPRHHNITLGAPWRWHAAICILHNYMLILSRSASIISFVADKNAHYELSRRPGHLLSHSLIAYGYTGWIQLFENGLPQINLID